jgi:DNA topoisomerase-1
LLPKTTRRGLKIDEAAFAALLAQADKRARLAQRKLAAAAGTRRGKSATSPAQQRAQIERYVDDARLSALLKKSLQNRKRESRTRPV